MVLAAALPGCATISRTLQPLGLTSGPGFAYDVALTGASGELATRLEDASVLFSKKSTPPATLQGLRQRALADRDVFLRVLHSRGYYDSTVTWSIDSTVQPANVGVEVHSGERYRFSRFDVEGLPAEAVDLATPAGLASFGLVADAPALAESVLEAENGLVAALGTRGFPYAGLATRDARIDRCARTMEVVLRVDAGPLTRFGDVKVEGLTHVDDGFVRRRVTFHRGDVYSPAKVEETRKALFASGVFSGVSLGMGKRGDVGPDGQAPVHVVVTEGDMHTVGAGLKYSSSEGFGGRAFWENRNLTGIADRLRAEIEVTQEVITGDLSYRRPDFLAVGQSLLLDASATDDQPPAYTRYALGVSAGLEHPFSRRFVGTAGLSLEQSDVNSAADADGLRKYTLFGLPLGLRFDGSDNLLDPTRGHRTLLSATPYVSALGESLQMLSLRGTQSFYLPLSASNREIWATRLTLGSVIGPSRVNVPADKRIYAGGGDSVRGFAFQYLGPLTDIGTGGKHDWKPKGGRSLLQVGTEVRWKITKNFGVVPFVEGAGVYESSYPDFRESFLWAAGLGLRYFTVAGPIRLDVGFPLNPRSSDQVFQVYISLGQAF